MRTLLIIITVLLGLIVTACGSKGIKAEMSRGERLFRSSCNSCHALPKASRHSDEEWPLLVNRYSKFTKLDDLQRLEIIEYLQASN